MESEKKSKSLLSRIAYPLLIGIGFLFIYQYIFDEKLNLGGDNAGYYVLGKALSEGQGYTNIHMPDNPPHNHFPPGYPAFLSVFMKFTNSINFLKILNGVLLLSSSLLLFSLLKKFTENTKMAFVGAILLLFNFHLLSYSTIMMSEIPYLFFSLLIIRFFIDSLNQENIFKNPQFYLVVFISSYAYHIRTAGLALVGGIILYLLFRKKFKYLIAYALGFIALGLPWFFRGQSIGGNKYISQLFMINPYRPEYGPMAIGDFFTRFYENFVRYLSKEVPNALLPFIEVDYKADAELSQIIVGLIMLAIIIFGIIKLPKYRDLIIWYLVGTFGILLLWPQVWFGIRFILPLVPFLLFLLVFGSYKILEYLFITKLKVKSSLSPLIMLSAILLFIPQLQKLNASAAGTMQPKYLNYFQLASYTDKVLPKDAVVCCRKPTLYYLYGNRKTTGFASSVDYGVVLESLEKRRVTHVIVDQLGFASTGRYLLPAIQANPEKFKLVQKIPNPDTYLFTFDNSLGYNGEWKVIESQDPANPGTAVKEGKGSFKYLDGRFYEGEWSNNLKNGKGVMTYPDGRVESGEWINDQYQSSQG